MSGTANFRGERRRVSSDWNARCRTSIPVHDEKFLNGRSQARCRRPGMCMETLRYHLRPLLSYMVTGGAGPLLDIWTVEPFRVRVTYATYAIARVCAPRIRASVER